MTITAGSGGVNRNITAVTSASGDVNRTITSVTAGNGGVNRNVFALSNGILYNNGDLCTAVTGGWEVKSYLNRTTYVFTTSPTLSMTNTSTGGWISEYPINIIDVTAWSKLKIILVARTSRVEFGLTSAKVASPDPIVSKLTSVIGTFEIDISAVTGSYYVYIATDYMNGSKSSVSAVWLE